jgi:hypothetical protein
MITYCKKCNARISYSSADKPPELCGKCLHAKRTAPPVVSTGFKKPVSGAEQQQPEGIVPDAPVGDGVVGYAQTEKAGKKRAKKRVKSE